MSHGAKDANSALTGEPKPADVTRLEAELSALWRSAARDPENRDAVTRSCQLTLLVYVETEEAAREALNLVSRVMSRNPARAVIMTAQPASLSPGLTAQIALQCRAPAAGKKELCCEQVVVSARGDAVAGLGQVVLPLLVPGVPVYLWWRAGGFSPPSFLSSLLRSVARVLVDSGRFPSPEEDLPRLYKELRTQPNLVVTDLNWGRLTPWRELIAECFDSPEGRPHLDELAQVRIEYERNSPRILIHRAQSLLLIGWLASRLNWQPVERSEDGTSFVFHSGQRSVRVERVPCQFEGAGAGVCVSITMKTGGDAPAIFTVRREPDGKTARSRRQLPDRPPMERAVRLEVRDEGDLLNGEIRFSARDLVYEEALGLVSRSLRSG